MYSFLNIANRRTEDYNIKKGYVADEIIKYRRNSRERDGIKEREQMAERNKIRYDAFISYRHLEKDMKIAVKLQKLLERGKINDEDTGGRRNLHIFRDQSELPTSDNLGQDIRAALENSGFLIILCSRETKKSRYCMEEIRYFRSLHGNTNYHILPVLLEGEPAESFPEILMSEQRQAGDESGNLHSVLEEVEPLAADVRADSMAGMLKKLYTTEYMRLEAPILGVAFDELYKRKQRQRIYQGIGVGAVLLAASLAFGLYNSHMLRQLSEKQEQLLRNESMELAYGSEQELKNGNRVSALEKALAGLPDEETDRPVLAPAVNALADALYAYQQPSYHTEYVIEQGSEIFDAQLSQDGDFLVTLDVYGILRAYRCDTQTELWRKAVSQFDNEYSAPDIVIVESQQAVLCREQRGAQLLSLEDGSILWSIDFSELECSRYGLAFHCKVSNDETILAVNVYDQPEELGNYEYYQYLVFYDMETGEVKRQTDILPIPQSCSSESARIFSPDDSTYVGVFRDHVKDVYYLVYVDVTTGRVLRTPWVKGVESRVEDDLSLTWMEEGEILPEGVLLYLCEYNIGSSYGVTHIGYLPDNAEEWAFYDTYSQIAETETLPYVCRDENVFVLISNTTAVRINQYGYEIKRVQLPREVIYCRANPENKKTVLVFEDGTLNILYRDRLELSELYNCEVTGFSLKSGSGSEKWDGPCYLISEEEVNKVYICKINGDENGAPLPWTDTEEYVYGEIYAMPDGNQFLCLRQEDSEEVPEGYSYWHHIIGKIYDADTQTETEVFSFEQQLFDSSLEAVSADGTKLFLKEYIYDLSAHELIQPEGIDPDSLNYDSFRSVAADAGVLSAAFDGTSVIWWTDGENKRESAPCPEELEVGYSNSDYVSASDQGNYAFGKNGLYVIKNTDKSDSNHRFISFFMIYSTEEDKWIKVEDISETKGYPYVAIADKEKWIAVADCDNVLRIYDQSSQRFICEFNTGLTNYCIKKMHFILDDRFLVVEHGGGSFQKSTPWISVIDTGTGDIVASYYPRNGRYFADFKIVINEEQSRMYIFDNYGDMDGFCIDLENWEVLFEIPNLRCVLQDERVIAQHFGEELTLYPHYDVDALIAWGRKELGN